MGKKAKVDNIVEEARHFGNRIGCGWYRNG